MSAYYRPSSVLQPRSVRRRASSRRLLALALALAALVVLVGGTFGLLRLNERFRVNRVVLTGVPDSRRGEAEELTDPWINQPLLFADVDGPVSRLSQRAWVARVSARRIVPDTISVQVTARPPIALARRDGELWTVDRSGTWLGPYTGRSVSAHDDFVVLDVAQPQAQPDGDGQPGAAASKSRSDSVSGVLAAAPAQVEVDSGVASGAALVERLEEDDPALLARASEITVRKDGFTLVDKVSRVELAFGPDALEPGQAAASWRAFLAVLPELERHGLTGRSVDLRFANRIVLKAPAEDSGRGKT